jgi:hypothetical protein
MAMSGRKKVATHTHTDKDVKQAAAYDVERPPRTGVPASEVIIDADAESQTTLEDMSWAQKYQIYVEGSVFYAKDKTGIIVSQSADAHVVFQWIADNAPNMTYVDLNDGTYPDVHVVVTDKKIVWEGDGRAITIIKPKTGYVAFTLTSAAAFFDNAGGIRHLSIDAPLVANGKGILLHKVSYVECTDVAISTTGNAFEVQFGYNNRFILCDGRSSGGSAFKVDPPAGQISADTYFTDCSGKDSLYGFNFQVGSNGFHCINCLAMGNSTAAFYHKGVESGGWHNNSVADQNAGDGFVFEDETTHMCETIQMSNCWTRSNRYGMWLKGSYASQGIVDLQCSNVVVANNTKAGIRVEGYVQDAKFQGTIRDNDTSNGTDDDATNILVINDPQQIEFANCQIGYIYSAPSNRKDVARVVMTTGAHRNTIVRFDNCTLRDATSSAKALVGLKNTSATYTMDIRFGNNNPVDQNVLLPYEIEAGSTGTISVKKYQSDVQLGENLARNGDFEYDLDKDAVPDFWAKYTAAGAGSIGQFAADQILGKYSCRVNANAYSAIAALSDYIPCDPNKPLYLEVQSKPSVNNANVKIEVYIYGYDINLGFIGAKSISNGSRSTSAWTKDTMTTTPATDAAFGANRANIRYIRIGLYDNGSSFSIASYILFDAVYLSLQRAAVATNGTVGASGTLSGSPVAVGASAWTTIGTITVAAEEIEEFLVDFYIVSNEQHIVQVRLRDNTDSIYYPSTNGIDCPVLLSYSGSYYSDKCQIPIPKNVKSHTIYVQLFTTDAATYTLDTTYWGHSPHTHI